MARATNTAPQSNDSCSPAAQVCPVWPADAKAGLGVGWPWLKATGAAGEKLETGQQAADRSVLIALAAEPPEATGLYWRLLPADP